MSSISDLHYRLGKLVEQLPLQALPRDRPPTNAGRHYFEEIAPVPYVDMSAVDRLEAIARDYLASLSPERRDELQADWENGS